MKKTVAIRLPEELHEKIKELAAEDHRTVSSYLELLILKAIENK